MSATTPTRQALSRPRLSTLDRSTLMQLAATEYDRFASMLTTLSAEDWGRPTDCPGWDVRAMASHVLGMAEMAASMRQGIGQLRHARRRGGIFIDALTAVQVEARSSLTAREVTDRVRVVGPRAARARRRIPSVVRNRRLPIPQPVGGHLEDWTIGYLTDTILTRDTWMHRIDIDRATNRPLELSAAHDGALTSDVVNEWQPATASHAKSISPASRAATGASASVAHRSNSTRSSSTAPCLAVRRVPTCCKPPSRSDCTSPHTQLTADTQPCALALRFPHDC